MLTVYWQMLTVYWQMLTVYWQMLTVYWQMLTVYYYSDGGILKRGITKKEKMENKTICTILVISIALVIVVSGITVGSSSTIYVPDHNSTIQEAVDKVPAGGTIIVGEDNYTENVRLNKRLTIKSEKGPDNTIVHAFEVTADYVEIIGFTVKGSSGEGIYLMNADHCNISDNVVSGFYTGINLNSSNKNNITNNIVSGNHHGIYLSSSSNNNTLLNNIASNNDNQGITIESSSNNKIFNNTVSNNWIGTVLEGSSNNRVVGNNVSGNKHHNLRVSNSNSNNVTNNSASNSGLGIYLRYSSSNNITDNKCLNNGWKGIRLLYSSNNRLISNNVSDGRKEGIYLDSYSRNNWLISNDALNNNNHGIFLDSSSSNNRIMNNTVDSNHYHGIHLESSSNNITGNNVSNNPWGIVLYSSNSKKNRLNNNTVWNNTRGICLGYSSNNTLIKNTVSDNADFGIYLESANNNTIYNNYFNNTNNSYDNGNNTWSSPTGGPNIVGGPYIGGNYWSDYNGTNLDADMFGDTELPYNCSGGIKNGGDYYPLVTIRSNIVRIANNQVGEHYLWGAEGQIPDDGGSEVIMATPDYDLYVGMIANHTAQETTEGSHYCSGRHAHSEVTRLPHGNPDNQTHQANYSEYSWLRYDLRRENLVYGEACEGHRHFDCSGLVYFVYNQAGVPLVRTTVAGYAGMDTDIARTDLKPGDVCYRGTKHIGIYVGGNRITHAAGHDKGVITTPLDARWNGFGRLLPPELDP